MENIGNSNYRGHGGKGRLDRGLYADHRLDSPLPWDHVNTGKCAGTMWAEHSHGQGLQCGF